MSQIIVYTIRLNALLYMHIENKITGFPHFALEVLISSTVWHMKLKQGFYSDIPPACVSSDMKMVHALALEYLVAFYPICLILISYVCIHLTCNVGRRTFSARSVDKEHISLGSSKTKENVQEKPYSCHAAPILHHCY